MTNVIPSSPFNTSGIGAMIANTTVIQNVFQRIAAQFAKLYCKQDYIHIYLRMYKFDFQIANQY